MGGQNQIDRVVSMSPEQRHRRGGVMRIAVIGLLSAAIAFGVAGCDTVSPSPPPQEYSNAVNVIDPAGSRAHYRFDQVIRDGAGTVRLSIKNNSPYCIVPLYEVRLQIGMVDQTVITNSLFAVPPGQTVEVRTFSFRPRIDLTSITVYMDTWTYLC
jgi:hypothetical protein